MEMGVSVFHFSIKADLLRPLNYTHEYQIVFIEPSDGTHVFGIQLGAYIRPRRRFHLMAVNRISVHQSNGPVAGQKCPFLQGSGPRLECPIHDAVHSSSLA
jgi:hypothetical protein